MQNLSIIRQAVSAFIVKYGSNRCKIKKMHTLDGKNYTHENFTMFFNLYKQEIIPESLYVLNKQIATYDDFTLSNYYLELLEHYNQFNEIDAIQKKLYYETYIEPILEDFETYINNKYKDDLALVKLLKQVKLEFTIESDYILQYYDYKNFIVQEQENTNAPNIDTQNNNQNQQQNTNNQIANNQEINEQNIQKMEVLIYVVHDNVVNKVETAELELNINKPVKIEITLYAKTPQEATDVITSLSTLLKKDFINNLLSTNSNAKLLQIAIRKNKIIAYTLYDENNQVIEQKNLNINFKQTGLVLLIGTPILALIVFILYKVYLFITNPLVISIILFTIVLLLLMNTNLGRALLARILGQARNTSNKLEVFSNFDNIKLENIDVTNNIQYLAIGFYVLTAGLALLIYKLLGMPIMVTAIIYTIITAINLQSIQWDINGLINSIKYILNNFNTAFEKVFGAGSPYVSAKIGVVLIFTYIVFTVLKKIFSKKQSVNPPDQDKMLAEIQTKFR